VQKRSIKAEADFLDKLTKCRPIEGLMELIWNSLDADARNIRINYSIDSIKTIQNVEIIDDGIGLSFEQAAKDFDFLGGSHKRMKTKTPGGRDYHGSEGKGRYKALSVGSLVEFTSKYMDSQLNIVKQFKISMDNGDLKTYSLADNSVEVKEDKPETGMKVKIHNIIPKHDFFSEENIDLITETFAIYHLKYPDFNIFIKEKPLPISSKIKNTIEEEHSIINSGIEYKFQVRLIEWAVKNEKNLHKQMHYCSLAGITLEKDESLGFRTPFPVSIYILSDHIEELHRKNELSLNLKNCGNREEIKQITEFARNLGREYIRNRKLEDSKSFIDGLKEEKVYPFEFEAKSTVEEVQRQVFDILAVEVNDNLPKLFKDNKKVTLHYLKEALDETPNNRQKILKEIFELPEEKVDEFCELLNKTSLSNIIDTMNEVTSRLKIVQGLESILFEPDISKILLERQHLHKILANETWIFGDDYFLGNNESSLESVLKQHIKLLGRNQFVEIYNNGKIYIDFLEFIINKDFKELQSLKEKGKAKNKKFYKDLEEFVNKQPNQHFSSYILESLKVENIKKYLTFLHKCDEIDLSARLIENLLSDNSNDYYDQIKGVLKGQKCNLSDNLEKLFGAKTYKACALDVFNYINNPENLELIAKLIYSNDNEKLKSLIPDMCLSKQIHRGKTGYFENLIIELKRPSVTAGKKEIQQIKDYAFAVADEVRFDKEKTDWFFVLLVTNFDKDAEKEISQEGRKYGTIYNDGKIKIFLLKWANVINEAKARLQYLRDKLNLSMIENQEGLDLLKKKYSEYLPVDKI
jgi:hypothetical protein